MLADVCAALRVSQPTSPKDRYARNSFAKLKNRSHPRINGAWRSEWQYFDESMKENEMIGDRLQTLRKQKQLSQGDIEERTGLLRCYISRVENGHTVPTIETLEKMARALEVP